MTKVTISIQPGEDQELVRVHHFNMKESKLLSDTGLNVGTNQRVTIKEGEGILIGLPSDMTLAEGVTAADEEGDKKVEDMKLAELKEFAKANDIDLQGKTKLVDVRDIVVKATAKPSGEDDTQQSPAE